MELGYSLHRRSDGISGADAARRGLEIFVKVDTTFPDRTTVTRIPGLGEGGHLLVGRFGKPLPDSMTKTSVIARRGNVAVKVRATSHGQAATASVPPFLERMARAALAPLKADWHGAPAAKARRVRVLDALREWSCRSLAY
ncbi:hypothetical protein SMC26_20290 [Actinomadura fulvescens]|uniref:Uncharacterized protein n=1 Tax=Actinomadura fulvescens TaxID=46160 RepID=A0ABP6BWT8_9ACTN